jgi:hypothetical protein
MRIRHLVLLVLSVPFLLAGVERQSKIYAWKQVTEHAGFPGSYNFPLFAIGSKLWALHDQGNWYSEDGADWVKADLPKLDFNSGYQQYVLFNSSIFALGSKEGNYLNLKLGTRIAKTSADLRKWEIVAAESSLPPRVFYGAVVFDSKIWLFGGFDGQNYFNDVWNSSDGVSWRRVAATSAWQPRSNPSVIVFNNELWLFGGGIIDKDNFNDVWRSSDGKTWRLATAQMTSIPIFGYSPIVFDNAIWLIGANRNGTFESAMVVSRDGVHWLAQNAPWSPRGGTATAVFKGSLFMTGGKYSVTRNGKQEFIYHNDVWSMK